jgi:hypothetical protein
VAFDTLAYVKRLETAGIDRREAEAHAEAINETLRPDIATRTDLDALRRDLRADVGAVRAEMVAMEQRLLNGIRTELAQRELRMVGVMVALLGVLFALIRFTG